MSEDENRDASNLLLLCLPHAWEIDAVPDQYPADVLRIWKHDQLANYTEARERASVTDSEAQEAIAPFDLVDALQAIAEVVPFNPRMRSHVDAWKLATRKGHARRIARLSPLVAPQRRNAVLAHMAEHADPIIDVPKGQLRVLVAGMGAGKSELASRWWEQGLQAAIQGSETEIPLFFNARQVVDGLESRVFHELGDEPTRECRIVIDDLNGVSGGEAARLLMEARELVHVWPHASVLATARPGIPVPDDEKLQVAPWPTSRGADLVRVASGQALTIRLSTDTADLLTSPLTSLALAARLLRGRDARVPRAQVLSDLANIVVESSKTHPSDATWMDMSLLAVRILGQRDPVRADAFQTLPRVRAVVATGMVVRDDDALTFALPIFEHYFGAQAIKQDLVSFTVVAAESFPRWRYALAFAVLSASPKRQESLLDELARRNPAAAFWVLDEIADVPQRLAIEEPSNDAVKRLLRRRSRSEVSDESGLAVCAGHWLRSAEESLLIGVGPLADALVARGDGNMEQWGVWLRNGSITVARAIDRTPPPAVVELEEPHPKLASGWQSWSQFSFPISEFGRWQCAQRVLQRRLERFVKRRTLRLPDGSWLAYERMYYLGRFIYHFAESRHWSDEIQIDKLREKVARTLEQVEGSQHATWESRGKRVDLEDVRWLAAQIAKQSGDVLARPWPRPDRTHAEKWAWERYSPDLTLAIAKDVVRRALVGYRQLIASNFPTFGNAMGLYSMMPVRVEGAVGRFTDDQNARSVYMRLVLQDDLEREVPVIDMQLVNSAEYSTFWDFDENQLRTARHPFSHSRLQHLELPLFASRPATNLAYKWLARDLEAVGWLKRFVHYFD